MRKFNSMRALLLIVVGLLCVGFFGCTKDETISDTSLANQQFYQILKSYYLWNDKVPTLNPSNYSDPYKLLEAVRYQAVDRYSFVMSKQEYLDYFQNSVYVGFGFSLAFDAQSNLRVAYIFNDSPLASVGVTRGWRITHINGSVPTSDNLASLLGPSTAGVSAIFKMVDLDGVEHEGTFARKTVAFNSVLAKRVVDVGGKKVGYLAFQSFVSNSEAELNSAFLYFNQQGVEELVVDLRYNGGGLTSVATQLASQIIGSGNSSKVFFTYVHNSMQRQLDTTIKFSNNSYAINGLTKVAFIGTKGTASSSELVINGLKPYMDVKLVGAQTYGKPVGMYVFTYENYAFFPICFSTQNSLGVGDYYNGLAVDVAANDDLARDFGDPLEDSFAKALQSIGVATGVRSSIIAPAASYVVPSSDIGKLTGVY